MQIIDIHTHLGNILYLNGKELIYRKNVVKEKFKDPQDLSEKLLMRHFGLGKMIYKLSHKSITRGQVACKGDRHMEERIYYRNAKEILDLE